MTDMFFFYGTLCFMHVFMPCFVFIHGILSSKCSGLGFLTFRESEGYNTMCFSEGDMIPFLPVCVCVFVRVQMCADVCESV